MAATATPDPAADHALLTTTAADREPSGLVVRPVGGGAGLEYRKLLANSGNAVQALLGATTGADDAGEASGAEVGPGGCSQRRALQSPTSPSRQSLVRVTGSIETDYLNLEIALRARRVGEPSPSNSSSITAVVRRAAHEGLRPGSLTADDLRRELGLA